MGIEIERKFLLADDSWRDEISHTRNIKQAYMVDILSENAKASVRIRIEDASADINIKSASIGISRQEYEYAIPLADAEQLIKQLCHQPCIEKQRHIVKHAGHEWEIDEFSGDNAGLLVAEIELDSVDERFSKPAWLGNEVSDDPRYYNVNLLKHPYHSW